MTLISPNGALDTNGIGTCCHDGTGPLRIDLSRCTFVTPAGLVWLGTIVQHARATKRETHLFIDRQSEVARYLKRMGLASLCVRSGVLGDTFPDVRYHDPLLRFMELTPFESEGDSVPEDVALTIRSKSREWGEVDPERMYNSMFELAVNVEQHSGSPGLVAVQHFDRVGEVEFAVGDHGVGIHQSLEAVGLAGDDAIQSVRSAVETFATASRESKRGRGLPGLIEQVCDKWQGSLTVFSSGCRVRYTHGSKPQARTISLPFPGTLVVGRFRHEVRAR